MARDAYICLCYHAASGVAVSHGYVPPEHTKNESLAKLRAELLHEIQPIAERYLDSVKALTERVGYSLQRRAFL